jgi:BlaI family transcriptional regulator, penicillinase repressor
MTKPNKPTTAELEILDVLWELGPSTVRDVHTVIDRRRPTAYTTVLKQMQIMHAKGLARRTEKGKAHVYRPAFSQQQTQKGLVADLLERAFRGSALKLVQHVLETKPATPQELAEIRRLIKEAEERGPKK